MKNPTQNLMSNVMASTVNPVPQVGMGATELWFSDRHAATIIAVSPSGKQIVVQRDNAKRTDQNGMGDNQTYEYTPNLDAPQVVYTLRRNGRWVRKGDSMTGLSLSVGHRSSFHDFSR